MSLKPFELFPDRSEAFPLLKERCPPRQKSRVKRLKEKVEHLLTQATVENSDLDGDVIGGNALLDEHLHSLEIVQLV